MQSHLTCYAAALWDVFAIVLLPQLPGQAESMEVAAADRGNVTCLICVSAYQHKECCSFSGSL